MEQIRTKVTPKGIQAVGVRNLHPKGEMRPPEEQASALGTAVQREDESGVVQNSESKDGWLRLSER